MVDYLVVKVAGQELSIPYGNLTPNAPLEIDIRNTYSGKSRDIYLSRIASDDFKPAYEDLMDRIGSEVILGDMPHVSVVAQNTKIETPKNYIIDMFFPHGESKIDLARLSTHDDFLPSEFSREEMQLLILMSCHLTPEKTRRISSKVFHNPRYQHGWHTIDLVGLDMDGFRVGINPGFSNCYLEYIGPEGESGYKTVVPKLAEHLKRKISK